MDPLTEKALVAGIALVLGTLITSLFTRSGKVLETRLNATQQLYDQLQEDLNAERRQRQLDVSQIHSLLRVNHIQADYIVTLRKHIIDEQPPPPPAWPPGLTAESV